MKNWILGAWATCRFEMIRSFTLQRLAVSAVLILFPPAMLTLVIIAPQPIVEIEGQPVNLATPYVTLAMLFLVALVCVLSLLLWATPNLQSELEGNGWGFIAMRPGGRVACFLGKYLTAVLTSFAISILALTICILIANRYSRIGNGTEPLLLWVRLTGIYALACVAYGAIFSFIGTIFIKRAMVIAAIYMVFVEVLMSALPAVISQITMSYHLRNLGELWIGWFPLGRNNYANEFGAPGSNGYHLACLGIAAILMLVLGSLVIVNRQYISSEES